MIIQPEIGLFDPSSWRYDSVSGKLTKAVILDAASVPPTGLFWLLHINELNSVKLVTLVIGRWEESVSQRKHTSICN